MPKKILDISIIIITKDAEGVVGDCLASISGWVSEIIVVDDIESSAMKKICYTYGARYLVHEEPNLGAKKKWAIEQSKCAWVFVLDADERVSKELKEELERLFANPDKLHGISSLVIPFHNHFLGRRVSHGGEDYKMPRIFRRKDLEITPLSVHEGDGFCLTSGTPMSVSGHIDHYSYRSIFQVFRKFTDYGIRAGKEKFKKGEDLSLKKLFIYPLHMTWARFIEDKGYKDGLFRLPLDISFGYMEAVTYWTLLFLYLSPTSWYRTPES